jgi:predicted phage terminase large subunit-like protein
MTRADAALELMERRCASAKVEAYMRYTESEFEPAKHHRLIIAYLEAVARRDIKRLMIFVPPGSAKSTYASIIFPAWYLGKFPDHNVLGASHSSELAERFGRKVRGLYSAKLHHNVFGHGVSSESAAAGRWSTTAGGEYFAAGVGTGIAGFRSDLGLIDDPFRSREDADSPTIREKVWDWYKADFATRLKRGAVQILIMTRWHPDDLAGRLLEDAKDGGLPWTVLKIPMECVDADDPLERKIGERLWPEWYSDEMVVQAKRDSRNWSALYQQSPIIDGGNILRRDWWRKWDGKHPPECSYILQSWDTAFSDKDSKTNSYSARTTWGVFRDRQEKTALILIEAWRGRVDYPTLRAEALKSYREHKPDCVLIEKKASGQSLLQDMRRSGVPVAEYQPDRDKVSRAYAVQAMLESGQIYYPPRRWADDVIDECAQFPHGATSDYVDTCTQAWLRIRNAGLLIQVPEKEPDEPDVEPLFGRDKDKKVRAIYG